MRSAIVLRVWHFFFHCCFLSALVVVGVVAAAVAVAVDFHRIGSIRHLSLNTNCLLSVLYCLLLDVLVSRFIYSFFSYFSRVCVFLACRAVAFRVVCDLLYIGFIIKAIRIYTQLCTERVSRFTLARSLFTQHIHLCDFSQVAIQHIIYYSSHWAIRFRRTFRMIVFMLLTFFMSFIDAFPFTATKLMLFDKICLFGIMIFRFQLSIIFVLDIWVSFMFLQNVFFWKF